jgi:hypothetical protein
MKRYLLACIFCIVAATAQAQLNVGPLDHRLLGAANGVAELDNTGKVPTIELPFSSTSLLSISNTWTGAQTFTAGTINGMSIGATTASTGAFTTLSATSTVSGTGFTTLLSPYLKSATATTTYQPLLGFTPYNATNPNNYQTAAQVAASMTAGIVYTLPVATATVLGGVKPDGTSLTNNSGALSVTFGTAAATAAQGNDSRITGALAAATATATYAPLANPTFSGTVTVPILHSTGAAALASLNSTPIGTTAPASGAFTTVRMARRTILTGATDTATVNDYVVAWKSSTAFAKTETLPTCNLTNDGMVLVIKDVTGDAATNPITLAVSSGTIDLGTTWVIVAGKGSITMQCDGSQTNWMIE